MNDNQFLNEQPEQVILIPGARIIHINNTLPQRAYGLFDTRTGVQVKDFAKGNDGQIEFNSLEPSRHYDVGVIEDMGDMEGDEKPQFAIVWNRKMRDTTDEILKNAKDLPVEYPHVYHVRYNDNNSNGVYDIVDDNGETVGQVTKLSPQGDKPEFNMVCSFKMKDDTIK